MTDTQRPPESNLWVYGEDGGLPWRKGDTWQQSAEQACELARIFLDRDGVPAGVLMVSFPEAVGELARHYVPRLEDQYGVRVHLGIKGDTHCENPADFAHWNRIARAAYGLYGIGQKHVFIVLEAALSRWWMSDTSLDYDALFTAMGQLPCGPTYMIYPTLIAAWPGVNNADAQRIERMRIALQGVLMSLPADVCPVVTSPYTGSTRCLTPWEVRCRRYGKPVEIVYVSDTNQDMITDPEYAAIVLKDAAYPTIVYVENKGGTPLEQIAGLVQAERSKLEGVTTAQGA